MNEFPNQLQLQHITDIAEMKIEIKNMKENIVDLSFIKEIIMDLKVSFAELSATLKGINNNMDIMNTEMREVNQRVGNLEGKMSIMEDAKQRKAEEKKFSIQEKIEDKKSNAEVVKAKFAFYGVLISSILSIGAIILQLILK